MFIPYLQTFIIGLSMSTAAGMVVHDLQIDKAAVVALASPAAYSNFEAANKLVNFGELHTHVERMVFSSTSHEPMIGPRSNESKKHLLQKYAARGHHAFDNYNLPIV
jgi:hypothetical protein